MFARKVKTKYQIRAEVTSDQVINHLKKTWHLATKDSDYFEKDADYTIEKIKKYPKWKKIKVTLSDINGGKEVVAPMKQEAEEELARVFAKKHSEIPAIVLHSDLTTIDGRHRARAAFLKNLKTIDAYVPIIATTDDLPFCRVREYGVLFETGHPVTFKFIRNTVSSKTHKIPKHMYQQNLDPVGTFMLHNPNPGELEGWEAGEVSFKNPLVIKFNLDDEMNYNDKSWKAVLSKHYNATGKKLTNALIHDGYDGIVTVHKGSTSEIVKLT